MSLVEYSYYNALSNSFYKSGISLIEEIEELKYQIKILKEEKEIKREKSLQNIIGYFYKRDNIQFSN